MPEPEIYGKGVASAVERMWRGEFSKVVLARTLELTSEAPLDLPAMLQRLARRDPAGYTFALPTGPGRTLIGASPELLVSRHGRQVVANPLAGSTPRSADLAEDVRRAATLLSPPRTSLRARRRRRRRPPGARAALHGTRPCRPAPH